MKLIFSIFLAFLTLITKSQTNYKVKINDTTFYIALDKNYKFKVGDQLINIEVSELDTISYSDDLCSFKYLKDYRVSKTDLGDGIIQISILTSEGSGYLIQTYTSLNPTKLTSLLMDEVTKESLNYGYAKTESTYSKNLVSGQKIDITKQVLKYKDEINIYEIAAMGKKDSGVIILTMKMDDKTVLGDKIINLLWASFRLK